MTWLQLLTITAVQGTLIAVLGFVKQARENPATFSTLVGKVLPLQVKASDEDPTIPPTRIVHEHRPPLPESAAIPEQAGVQRLPGRVTDAGQDR
jgi:hypothetical protein